MLPHLKEGRYYEHHQNVFSGTAAAQGPGDEQPVMWSSCNRSRVFEEHRRPLLRHSVVCNMGTHCGTHSPGDTSSLKADARATLQNTSSPRNRSWPESLQSRWLCWCSTFPILLTWVVFLSNFNYTLKLQDSRVHSSWQQGKYPLPPQKASPPLAELPLFYSSATVC